MQMTEMELLHTGEQLRSEAVAIAKFAASARQTADPRLQQMYMRAAERHRNHYETILRQVQNFAAHRQY
ncbi:MAG TPA: hypothetical protein PK728_06125 [Bacillota bacterium]|nr:hypothetical protein [Bacillota bacterium]